VMRSRRASVYPKDDATAQVQDQHAYQLRLMRIESSFGFAPTSVAVHGGSKSLMDVGDLALWDGRDDHASTGASWRHLLAEGSQLAPAEQPAAVVSACETDASPTHQLARCG
jgi:hypothetical protein